MAQPTQKQVAQQAGVSQTVVSQVLNGQADLARIHPETRLRVQEAIQALGYVPNMAARRLVGRSSSLIGVFTYEAVFPSHTRNFYAPFLEGIEQEASRVNLDLLLYTSGGKAKRRLIESTRGRLALTDGTVLLGHPDLPDRLQLATLVQTGHPVVFIGRREVPGISLDCIEADYQGATEALTRQFQDLGHQNLCYLGPPVLSESALDRQLGFQTAAPTGLIKRLLLQDLNPEFLKEQRRKGITGFLVENDELMRGLLSLCRSSGLQPGKEVSVALLGDAITGTQHEQTWTRFKIPRQQMGRRAIQTLRSLLTGTKPQLRRLPCQIVKGNTLGRVLVNEPDS